MDEPGRYVTRREFEEVMRRAAELASEDSDTSERAMPESEVLRIAREVGLPERHVRSAIVSLRTEVPDGRGLGSFLGPSRVRAARPIAGSPDSVADELDEFMVAGQLLQSVRRGRSVLVYRPAVDWVSQVARAASSTSRRYYVASAKHVEVRLSSAGEGETMVELEVDPGIRGDYLAGVIMGGGASGVAGGVAVGLGVAAVAPAALAIVAGAATGVALAGLVSSLIGRSHKKKLREVRTEMEGILDRLESGESLEPPPPSWRRWVRRHFHGVARDLRGEVGPEMDDSGDGR